MAASKNDDWRCDCKDTVEMQNKARHDARFTDIQFQMGEGTSKKVFNAHKAILACVSPVFEKMFYGSLAEKRNVINTDDDPEAFEMLLNFIYGKSNSLTSLTHAWKYFTIGDKYLVPKISDAAKIYIKSKPLTEDGFWDIMQINIYSSPLLCDKVNSYMTENANKLIQSEKFLYVPEAIIESIIQMDKLNVQEYQLLSAVTKWTYFNKKNPTKTFLLKYYKHIRFSTLTCDEFFKFIDSYPKAIDAENYLEILRYLHNPSYRKLPEWCTKSNVLRNNELSTTMNSTTTNSTTTNLEWLML